MDAVNAFNQELFSLMDMKPPISRAKMILITKAAIKAIKLYKHVVQIVEKFIKKCKAEYKVPGLYVIDSIVRQSRHQFGADKDVFGPRFSKNITSTFQNLYLCPSEEKSKIVRVLNLWQKNGVFKIEIIQPLLDMAAGASSAAPQVMENTTNNADSPPPPVKVPAEPPPVQVTPPPQIAANSVPPIPPVPQLPTPDAFAAVAQLFQSTQGQQLQQILQTFQQPPKSQSPVVDNNVLAQVQAITTQLPTTTAQPVEQKATFDKKLLDRFDYDDEPEATEDAKKEDSTPSPTQLPFGFPGEGVQPPMYPQLPPGQLQNMEPFQQRMLVMQQDSLRPQVPLPPNGQMPGFGLLPTPPFPAMAQPAVAPVPPVQPVFQPAFQPQTEDVTLEVEQPCVPENKRHSTENRRSRSRSASSRSPKRRRSRSGSRSRRSRHRRSRSRSRDRRRHSPRSRSQERRDREKERERRQKGLPSIKPETVSVCSTTLWIGQLDKRTTQQDVASHLEEFGAIESINMIPPRGCAYIVMVHRHDAYRALQKLSRGGYKINLKSIKIAWALNKGIKPDIKQYWDVDLGVTYIPWDKVKPEELASFCEGGILDNDTLCPDWKDIPKKPENAEVAQNGGSEALPVEEPLPVAIPAPVVPPAQVPGVQPMPPVSPLQPPAFSGPLGIPPPGFAPGMPPPPPPQFLRPGFNPLQLPPGFLPPPSALPPMSSAAPIPPSPGANIQTSATASATEDPSKDSAVGNPIPTVVSGPRGNSESAESTKLFGSVAAVGAANLPPSLAQPFSVMGAPPGTAAGAVIGSQPPSTGLLGARPGLIPLQRPPGIPPPHLQRFPLLPPRPNMPVPPHLLHRGPPPGPGGFGMPPPHGIRAPFPPHNPFIRVGGPGVLGGPDDREGRQFRNDRQGFPPGRDRDRDQERFGRRPFGNRGENDSRDRYGNRHNDRDHERPSGRERREWGRSPEHERPRDLEERSRQSNRHQNRDRDSRDRESRRDREENRGKEKPETGDAESSTKKYESNSNVKADDVTELTKEEPESTSLKQKTEELPSEPTSSAKSAEDDSDVLEQA
ncbi:SR-related and CTD-associated factor 4 isoform X2 [Latimeria chalumnae]|uniref:SR-related and CTD-associated factor 4 isoform X2 n=1 Tax=Latimeria chalumnae TaxID=7897 RepID=UPI00313ECB2A